MKSKASSSSSIVICCLFMILIISIIVSPVLSARILANTSHNSRDSKGVISPHISPQAPGSCRPYQRCRIVGPRPPPPPPGV
ncbi:hypothetical protein F0562_033973 [Nyssa sinensis]|uniref:Transmembrane protein n=1 Tax=Nyssa sinensis TaxID=561372 RepID=A0A5J5AGC9_9ASTE|nr:hypothetical protein F0562_033973 [Nyssa sinensis]